ncbi:MULTISPECIES: SDR family oxidoreductase [Gemmobacter]|jgi:NAD(P)-dependent dehydrogenase (short-subunit alcohol dehydrogenase family)|uniref:NADP-dependent 3-hydroxy acid dehydrogenase YdfG n=1 Tax=Gemmobacter caeni TaxID=589035 RepID=A0A2T6ANM6_9RHOB|nr:MULTISPECIES: SDR family NAD(P)-dependent oxidoreductase [Gemmobacter]PTX45425.1 NADP-dependent 3-hydroxy acid dehydrogenase YdfG [Gemmobacter caeni]TWI93660.1 NADP-dependent 3-hydroxy acid dehydrogenase YdfG [Gemmobacter caeni]
MVMNGKVVAITGASRGIGAAAARVFAAAGAKVALLARSEAEMAALTADIGADRALALACDVADAAAVSAAVAQIVAHWGQLDVLVNNAGMIEPIARIEDADPALWAQAVQVNLAGVFNGIRAALPVMKSAGTGTIITISSGAAHRPLEGWSAYCASKAGAAMLTRALHLEEGQWLRVMGLSPGTVATGMQVQIKASGINPVSRLEVTDHIPADWPAQALLWMCSPEADDWRGEEISLRDENIRRKVGLLA